MRWGWLLIVLALTAAGPAQAQGGGGEAAAWTAAQNDCGRLRGYFRDWPNGRFVARAKSELTRLQCPDPEADARRAAQAREAERQRQDAARREAQQAAQAAERRAEAEAQKRRELEAETRRLSDELHRAKSQPPPAAPPTAMRTSPPQSFVDARTTPASTRAPLVSDPASLPNFALFRECDVCPEMVVIPAGSFLMGSPAGEVGGRPNESPKQVSVRRFAMSRFETTWDQWTACVLAGGCNQGPLDAADGDKGWGRG